MPSATTGSARARCAGPRSDGLAVDRTESWLLQSQLAFMIAKGAEDAQAPALRDAQSSWSRGRLIATAERIAAALIERGARCDDVIALVAERTPLCIATILGIACVGAAYLPLDPSYPRARLVAMLEDAQPSLLIGDAASAALAPPGVAVCDPAALIAQAAAPCGLGNGRLAYVLFTSGSTGRPKGVAMTRSAVAALIDWHRRHPRLGVPARTLQFAPLGFDVSFQEIFSTLIGGGVLVLPSEAERRDAQALLALLERERIERLFLPYVALQSLAEAAVASAVVPRGLRDVITAGEALRITPSIRALFAALPDCVLHNHYGPTETHVVSAYELGGDPAAWPELPPIGHALPHATTRVVDGELRRVPIGCEGELLLGGGCLAAGYIHRPELTSERFVMLDGERWYRTGDLVRCGCNGVFDYLGRCDEQIKLAGHRIEPGEIESVLAQHPAVAAVAVVLAGEGGDARLVAHVVVRAAQTRDGALEPTLRAWCARQLPDYMQPQRVLVQDAFPLTPSGKVDRRKLARMAASAPGLRWIEGLPIERQLASLWCQLLGVERIDTRANVFDLGARSLTAMRVAAELQRHGYAQASATRLYEYPSIARLAAFLEHASEPARSARDTQRGQRQRAALAHLAAVAASVP